MYEIKVTTPQQEKMQSQQKKKKSKKQQLKEIISEIQLITANIKDKKYHIPTSIHFNNKKISKTQIQRKIINKIAKKFHSRANTATIIITANYNTKRFLDGYNLNFAIKLTKRGTTILPSSIAISCKEINFLVPKNFGKPSPETIENQIKNQIIRQNDKQQNIDTTKIRNNKIIFKPIYFQKNKVITEYKAFINICIKTLNEKL